MINGLGVLGWGVGGIEAEAAMLGQPVSMLIPEVVGFKLKGQLREGVTATDLVLTATQMLRAKGVVGRFVEYYGPGLDSLSLADRATLANMRSEEHTSELQSLMRISYAVFCFKKKKKTNTKDNFKALNIITDVVSVL